VSVVNPGSLVRYRERDWVVMPSDDPALVLLRPLGGSSVETCGVWKPLSNLMGASLPFERITPSHFPLPEAQGSQDHGAVRLLVDAARLLLRDGAAPFRSLGHLSVRPRPYQFVPMLMALRLDTVRMLIADDVGVGKTIEAALIARELLDRGEVRRVGVLCPPYLCDQWQRELAEKFHLDATVIRSGTVSRLERLTPRDRSVFQHHQHFVASIDLVKGERYRPGFLLHCPDLLLVDEAHGAAQPPGERRSRSQQQRHDLLQEVAKNPNRNLILLTATPHSGAEDSFLSLLGLLQPEFATWSLAGLDEAGRTQLSRHFVQRRRTDVERWMDEDTPFPRREPSEDPYTFTGEYRAFYSDVYQFAREMVRSAETLTGWKARMRFWSALALLRCVTSSPAAAEASLIKRMGGDAEVTEFSTDALDGASDDELAGTFEPVVYDPSDAESVVDAPPTAVFEAQEQDPDWPSQDRRHLRDFARQATRLRGKADAKLLKVVGVVRSLLSDGFHPIVWCRYIATSEYIAEELQGRLEREFKGLRVTSITGTMVEDERRMKVAELGEQPRRVLVATDCLSEGINLQDHFNAVVHYDLPWNPNRLEQREGRVDRFGQAAPVVKAVLIFGQDNPVDGAVLDVLIRKARDIYRDLQVNVPVPQDSETVMEAVLKSVFARSKTVETQLGLFDDPADLGTQTRQRLHAAWDRTAERERVSRTRFAQAGIKPDEVRAELEQTDAILGDPGEVRQFLIEASQRMGFTFRKGRLGRWDLGLSGLPDPVRRSLGDVPDPVCVTFESPPPDGAVYIGRNHRLVECLAEHLVDQAFHPSAEVSPAARCGVIRTDTVSRLTTLHLLRLRFLLHERDGETPSLAEETLAWGTEGLSPNATPLDLDRSRQLLDSAEPVANVPPTEKTEVLTRAIQGWQSLQPLLAGVIAERGKRLEESHRRIRRLTARERIRIEPQMPPDLLGVLVLLPVPGRTPASAGVQR